MSYVFLYFLCTVVAIKYIFEMFIVTLCDPDVVTLPLPF